METYALSNTVCGTTNGTSNVSTVAESVSVGSADGVVSKSSTATELGVGDKDTRVDNVSVGVLSSGGVVDVRSGCTRTVADSTETPCSTGLGCQSLLLKLVIVDLVNLIPEVSDCVGLDESDLWLRIRICV
jgi:hypothetical protein